MISTRSILLLSGLLLISPTSAQNPTFVQNVRPGEDSPGPVAVTGEGGTVFTYVPYQDPAQATVTEVVTVPNEQGGEIVIYPGGWIWTLAAPPPEGQPVPPAPTQPPDQKLDSEPTEGEQGDGGNNVVDSTVTGDDGVVVTYSPSQDPEYTELAQTTTKAGDNDDDDDIIILPGGWIWKIKGSAPPGPIPPPPTGPPGSAVEGSEGGGGDSPEPEENTENDEDEQEEECSTTTAPPECTKTISYVSVGDDYTTTEMGECETPPKCVSGEQVTTTTTISASANVIIGLLPDPTGGPEIDVSGGIGKELEDYLQEYYESEGISLQEIFGLGGEPICKGGLVPIGRACLRAMIEAFCEIVDDDPTTKQKVQLDAKDILKKRNLPRAALHLTSLQQRQGKVNANSCGSQYYNFAWSGADGDCNGSCDEAMGALASSCGKAPDAVDKEGKIQVSCGQYSYWMSDEGGSEGGDSSGGDDNGGDEENDDSEDKDEDEDEDEDEDDAEDDEDENEGETAENDVNISPPVEVPIGSGGPP